MIQLASEPPAAGFGARLARLLTSILAINVWFGAVRERRAREVEIVTGGRSRPVGGIVRVAGGIADGAHRDSWPGALADCPHRCQQARAADLPSCEVSNTFNAALALGAQDRRHGRPL
jgi:hypothetical protein